MSTPLDLVRLQTALVDTLARQAATDRCGLAGTLADAPHSGSIPSPGATDRDWVWTRTASQFLLESADTVVRLQEPLHDPTAFDAVQWAIHTNTSAEDAVEALSEATRSGTLVDTGVPQVQPLRHRYRPTALQPPPARWLDPLQEPEGWVRLTGGRHAGPESSPEILLDVACLPILQQPFREALGDFDPFVRTPDIGPAATRRLADRLFAHARRTLVGFDATPAPDRPLDIHDLRWSLAVWVEDVLHGAGTLSIERLA